VEIEACQQIAQDLGMKEGLSFGASFVAVRDAAITHDEWAKRFEEESTAKAIDSAKTSEVAKGATDVDVEMEVDDGDDEGSVPDASQKGKARVLPHREVKRMSVVLPPLAAVVASVSGL
jgi:DUF1365 family protein